MAVQLKRWPEGKCWVAVPEGEPARPLPFTLQASAAEVLQAVRRWNLFPGQGLQVSILDMMPVQAHDAGGLFQ